MKLLVMLTLVVAAGAKTSYAGHKVFRLTSSSESSHFAQNFTSLAQDLALPIWREPDIGGQFADIQVPPSLLSSFEEGIQGWAELEVMHEDLGAAIEEEAQYPEYRRGSVNASWFSSYHPYKDHMTWLTDLQAKYSKNSEIITISKSIEGRDVSCIRIFGKEKGKPAIFFMGTLHAREWITTTTTEYIAQNLLENYRKDNDITAALDKYDVYIAPITNPDGFLFSQTSTRMWRKNRNKNDGNKCMGVDTNRNWPIDWAKTSKDPCAETYRGTAEGSEPEIRGLMSTMQDIKKKQGIKLFVDWHSYAQLVVYPWGYTCNQAAPRTEEHSRLALGAAEIFTKAKGARYKGGNTCKLFYAASGCSDDWVLSSGTAEYSFTIELRDDGKKGFVLPASEILPTGEESYAATKWLLMNLK